jgi:hypothetical protein
MLLTPKNQAVVGRLDTPPKDSTLPFGDGNRAASPEPCGNLFAPFVCWSKDHRFAIASSLGLMPY